MAYADYTFYTESFHGDTLTEANAPKWLERASDYIDTVTLHKTEFAFPEVEAHIKKVKKAVCAIAEGLYLIDEQLKAAQATADVNGNYHGAIASMSSGRESVSYASNLNASMFGKAATDRSERDKLLYGIALQYLAGVPDKNGINLLYAGVK